MRYALDVLAMRTRAGALLASVFALLLASCDAGASRPQSPELRGIPLIEVPAKRPRGRLLALVMSGDGDWADLIEGFSRTLADSGIPVIGLEARSYLRDGRTPEQTASDMARVLRTYLAQWGRDEILIAGYSRGADLAPFVVSRLPADLRARVRLVAMMSPATTANFHFHLVDLVRAVHRPDDIPVLPEVERAAPVRILCVYGREESESLCPAAPPGLMHIIARPGGHRTTDYGLLARLVLAEVAVGPG